MLSASLFPCQLTFSSYFRWLRLLVSRLCLLVYNKFVVLFCMLITKAWETHERFHKSFVCTSHRYINKSFYTYGTIPTPSPLARPPAHLPRGTYQAIRYGFCGRKPSIRELYSSVQFHHNHSSIRSETYEICEEWYFPLVLRVFLLGTDRRDHVFSIISKDIIERWDLLCQTHRQEYKFHTSLYITGYINLILGALMTLYEPEYRNQLLVQALQTLYLDLHMWYKNESQLQSIFFLNCTQVYYLLLTLESEYIDPQIFPLLKKLKSTLQRFNHAWKHGNYNEKEVLERYIDNLCIKND